jgi:DNA-binding response OmpR family regulator
MSLREESIANQTQWNRRLVLYVRGRRLTDATQTPLKVLAFLMQRPGCVVRYDAIINALDMHSRSKKAARHNLNVHVWELRQILLKARASAAIAVEIEVGLALCARVGKATRHRKPVRRRGPLRRSRAG